MPIEWTDGVVDASGLPLHYLRGGFVDGPVVVLLHGFTDNAGCWQRVADGLASAADVVAIDARNHGTSGTAVGSLADTATDVGAVIDALDLGPVDLVGHSLGACTAIELAVRRAPLVRRLVLEDPPWRSSARTEDVVDASGLPLHYLRGGFVDGPVV